MLADTDMNPAELFKTDFEEFTREALARRNYARRLRNEKFEGLREELDENGISLLRRVLGLMAEREDREANILEKALATRNEQDIDEALIVLHPDVAHSRVP